MARAPFSPTDEQLRTIEAMAGFGIRQEDIAFFMGVSSRVLEKRCSDHLRRGKIRANTQVGQTLFQMATGTGGQQANVAAAIYWTKSQMGWRQTTPDGPGEGAATYVLQIQR